jgi:hypothetical protein
MTAGSTILVNLMLINYLLDHQNIDCRVSETSAGILLKSLPQLGQKLLR